MRALTSPPRSEWFISCRFIIMSLPASRPETAFNKTCLTAYVSQNILIGGWVYRWLCPPSIVINFTIGSPLLGPSCCTRCGFVLWIKSQFAAESKASKAHKIQDKS